MTATLEKLKFVGDDPFEQYRAQTLYTKEPGTIQWLQENCREGDVVYDIGANIGCYTLIAAQLVGDSGVVYAFEPHVGNAASLLRNIEANGLQGRIRVVTAAVDQMCGFEPFEYASIRTGSSGSQYGHVPSARALAEYKAGVSLDAFALRTMAPSLIKIDVDGNELKILKGAGDVLLFSTRPPRSVQVEIPPETSADIYALMAECQYSLERIHYTSNGQKQIDAGVDPSTVIHNAIFRKVA